MIRRAGISPSLFSVRKILVHSVCNLIKLTVWMAFARRDANISNTNDIGLCQKPGDNLDRIAP